MAKVEGYVELKLPPGVVRPGSKRDAKGRWYDTNFVRWYGSPDGVTMSAWGGWSLAKGATSLNSKPIRGMYGWLAGGTPNQRLACGTYERVYVYYPEANTIWNLTPGGMAAGSQNAPTDGEATWWSFDDWDGDLLAVKVGDGVLYRQVSASPTSALAAVSGAPTSLRGIVVTPEKIAVALQTTGSVGTAVSTLVWCDQDDLSVWTPLSTNQAGDQPLSGGGTLMAGRRLIDETLIWTNVDLWGMRYVGGDLVFNVSQRGRECGAVSGRAMTTVGNRAFWMGRNSFWVYDGFARQMPCPVLDYVFGRLNNAQRSKVACWSVPEYGEVVWSYPSGSGTPECDSYVVYNYLLDCWYTGFWTRTDGVPRGVFTNGPYYGDSTGALYQHETGTTMTEESGSSYTPYAESGPIELRDGYKRALVRQYVPDGVTAAGVTLTIYSAAWPTASETTHGPYSASNPTDFLIDARQVRVKLIQSTAGWRFGSPRLELVESSRW